jgi:hypothetical protein
MIILMQKDVGDKILQGQNNPERNIKQIQGRFPTSRE